MRLGYQAYLEPQHITLGRGTGYHSFRVYGSWNLRTVVWVNRMTARILKGGLEGLHRMGAMGHCLCRGPGEGNQG
jgi:hypothetical protein